MKNLKRDDWALVRAGVFCSEPLLLKVLQHDEEIAAYAVVDINRKFNHGRWFWMDAMVPDTGYAVKVPESNNIEMLNLLYMPEKGSLDEETQN